MICIDSSIGVKWFKPGERYEAEALELLSLIDNGAVEAAANEILSLEVVRGLKNFQSRYPVLRMTDERIERAFDRLEGMFRGDALKECTVNAVKRGAKNIQLRLGLFMADAIHLATAVHLGAEYLVVDDHHFLMPEVVNYAAGSGVSIVNLPDLISALDAAPTNGDEPTTQNP